MNTLSLLRTVELNWHTVEQTKTKFQIEPEKECLKGCSNIFLF